MKVGCALDARQFYGDAMRRITARTAALSAIFLAGALALGGCSAGGGVGELRAGERRRLGPDGPGPGRLRRRVGSATDGDGGTGGASVTDNRDLITIGTVTVTTEDPIAAARGCRAHRRGRRRTDRRPQRAQRDRGRGRLRDAHPAHPRERAHRDSRPHQGPRHRRRGRHQVDRRHRRAPGPRRRGSPRSAP